MRENWKRKSIILEFREEGTGIDSSRQASAALEIEIGGRLNKPAIVGRRHPYGGIFGDGEEGRPPVRRRRSAETPPLPLAANQRPGRDEQLSGLRPRRRRRRLLLLVAGGMGPLGRLAAANALRKEPHLLCIPEDREERLEKGWEFHGLGHL